MPKIHYSVPVVIAQFDETRFLAEPLMWPAYASFGKTATAATDKLKVLLQDALPKQNLMGTGINRGIDNTTIETLAMTLPPYKNNLSWQDPLALEIPIVRYRKGQAEGGFHWMGRVPWMDLEFSSRREENWWDIAEKEILRCLLRRGCARDIKKLLLHYGVEALTLVDLDIAVHYPTSLEALKGIDPNKEQSALQQSATHLVGKKGTQVFRREKELARIAEALNRMNRRGILLVGPSGVGKTAVSLELVNQRARYGLKSQAFFASNGARLIAGKTGFGEWQEHLQKLVTEAMERKAVLLLGSLFELSQVGQSERMSQGIAAFLRPYIADGRLSVICECTAEQIALLEKKDPILLQAFERFDIHEPKPETLRNIIGDLAVMLERRHRLVIEPAACDMVVSLFQRFAGYSAQPRPAVQFLKNLCAERNRGETVTRDQIPIAFSQVSGLPHFILDRNLPMDLAETTAYFENAVIGQREAIRHVVDMLATVKAQLTQPERPIGSFLFIGPTGVGKTETAKTIAQWLFSDAKRLTRFDMSEFSDEIGVRRLLAGSAKEPGLLTAAVREQPFSLLVFDEFEKAHPQFFDLLLQILGEGRLTDDHGRSAKFHNTVVIMTSNLGAERFDRGTVSMQEPGSDANRAQTHFTREVRRFLRPEIYNRIDAVVPFHALTQGEIERVTHLELVKLKRRAGLHEAGLDLVVSDAVTAFLSQRGYDPKLGARPLKRAVDQLLALPLAEKIAAGLPQEVVGFQARLEAGQLVLDTRERALEQDAQQDEGDTLNKAMLDRLAALRRVCFGLAHSGAFGELRSNHSRLGSQITRLMKRRQAAGEDPGRALHFDAQKVMDRFRRMEKDFDELHRFQQDLNEYENQCQCEWHGFPADKPVDLKTLPALDKRFNALLIRLWWYNFEKTDEIILGLYSTKRDRLRPLAEKYLTLAHELGMHTVVEFLFNKQDAARGTNSKSKNTGKGEGRRLSKAEREKRAAQREDQERPPGSRTELLAERGIFLNPDPGRFPVDSVPAFRALLKRFPVSILGLGLRISGPSAYLWFHQERGFHHWFGEGKEAALVMPADGSWDLFFPPEGVEHPDADITEERRRWYADDEVLAADPYMEVSRRTHSAWTPLMHELLYERMVACAGRHFS